LVLNVVQTGIIQLKKKDNQVVLFAYPHDVFVKLKITEKKFKPDQCKSWRHTLSGKTNLESFFLAFYRCWPIKCWIVAN